MPTLATLVASMLLSLMPTGPAASSDDPVKAAPAPQRVGAPYLLEVCVISGRKLPADGGKVLIHDGAGDKKQAGREFRFCCNGCLGSFKKEPAKFIPKVDELIITQQLPRYPVNATCPVMQDEALPNPTGPGARECKLVVSRNRLVRLCCTRCIRKFSKDPVKYLEILDAAVIAEAKASGRIDTCPISGRDLTEKANWFVIGDQAVGTCCGGCRRRAESDPRKTVASVTKAMKG
jgi:YHS domain-containing protein